MMLIAALMAVAQYRCDAPTDASWTTKYIGDRTIIVPNSLIFSVRPDRRGSAMKMLSDTSWVLLDEARARKMAGFPATAENYGNPPASFPPFGRDPNDRIARKPYLVRAVFPGKAPSISIGWIKDTLIVSTETLGCQPFLNEPLIVWLHKAPAAVAVNPGAAL